MIIREHKMESELKGMAFDISQRIAIRTYDGGNSRDEWRDADDAESRALFNIAFGALLTLNWGEDNRGRNSGAVQAIIDAAEFTCDLFIREIHGEECNGYMTMYCPLKKIVREWEEETERHNSKEGAA